VDRAGATASRDSTDPVAIGEETHLLLGRQAEVASIDRVLDSLRGGQSGVLVVHGAPGIGKTAVLEYAVGVASELHVVSVSGVQSETELGFAALHQLLVPFLAGVDDLPEPQRQALESAFGLKRGPTPDRFFVGLAALTLITEAAARRPVLCVIDDAQWLDRSSIEALGFLARRLLADPVGMLVAIREGQERSSLVSSLPELQLGGLPEAAAAELLIRVAKGPVSEAVVTSRRRGYGGQSARAHRDRSGAVTRRTLGARAAD
jgi:hypothetical protein